MLWLWQVTGFAKLSKKEMENPSTVEKIFRLIQVGTNTVPMLDFFQLSTGCSQVFDNMLCLTIHKNTSYSICLEEIHFWANNILPALSSYSGLV
ncbi:MAG: hypothetical protein HZT40_17780 [Candidatus Thiothrix singaporensis]|uniref:Uncharacterized protein n=1 Tax=Candidatus Thiothrix singaporensis TaxID=2799669 RepID=A0A7L6AVE2_9GAMM|nr:MAG: hypothetical protein HZT40_17780 [Candidatus Thiothrix singaporensis]